MPRLRIRLGNCRGAHSNIHMDICGCLGSSVRDVEEASHCFLKPCCAPLYSPSPITVRSTARQQYWRPVMSALMAKCSSKGFKDQGFGFRV